MLVWGARRRRWETTHCTHDIERVRSGGEAVIAGRTFSVDFPTRNALQASLAGESDVFVARLPLTGGPLATNASRCPALRVWMAFCSGKSAEPVAPATTGAPLASSASARASSSVFATSTASGASTVPIPLPPDAGLAGAQAFAQFYWADACAAGGISASNALQVTGQP